MLALKSGGEEDPELARSRAIRACMPVRGFSAEPAPPRPPPPPPSLDAVDAAAVSALGEAPGVDAEASSPPHSMPPSSSSSLLLSCRRKDAGRDMLRALSLEDFAERKLASLLALALVPLALTAGALAGALAGATAGVRLMTVALVVAGAEISAAGFAAGTGEGAGLAPPPPPSPHSSSSLLSCFRKEACRDTPAGEEEAGGGGGGEEEEAEEEAEEGEEEGEEEEEGAAEEAEEEAAEEAAEEILELKGAAALLCGTDAFSATRSLMAAPGVGGPAARGFIRPGTFLARGGAFFAAFFSNIFMRSRTLILGRGGEGKDINNISDDGFIQYCTTGLDRQRKRRTLFSKTAIKKFCGLSKELL